MQRSRFAVVSGSVAVLVGLTAGIALAETVVVPAVIHPITKPVGEAVKPTGPTVLPGPAVSQPNPTGQPPLGSTAVFWGWYNQDRYPWLMYAQNPCTTYLHVPYFVAGTEWVDTGADFTFIRPAQWHVIRLGMGQVGDYYVNLARDRFERPAGLIRVRVLGDPCQARPAAELLAATLRDYTAYGFAGQPAGSTTMTLGQTSVDVHTYTGTLDGRAADLVIYMAQAGGRRIVVSVLGDALTGNHVLANANRRAVGTVLATLNICGQALACGRAPATAGPCAPASR